MEKSSDLVWCERPEYRTFNPYASTLSLVESGQYMHAELLFSICSLNSSKSWFGGRLKIFRSAWGAFSSHSSVVMGFT
ncbi:MAG: hypothetical protein KGY76_09750 [Candidatus Thermoplasmatota archaeon]|nr:hypothetical protein [Candidatus Thermoplasmatota archaeon]